MTAVLIIYRQIFVNFAAPCSGIGSHVFTSARCGSVFMFRIAIPLRDNEEILHNQAIFHASSFSDGMPRTTISPKQISLAQ